MASLKANYMLDQTTRKKSNGPAYVSLDQSTYWKQMKFPSSGWTRLLETNSFPSSAQIRRSKMNEMPLRQLRLDSWKRMKCPFVTADKTIGNNEMPSRTHFRPDSWKKNEVSLRHFRPDSWKRMKCPFVTHFRPNSQKRMKCPFVTPFRLNSWKKKKLFVSLDQTVVNKWNIHSSISDHTGVYVWGEVGVGGWGGGGEEGKKCP